VSGTPIDDGGSAFPQPLAFDPANGNPVTADMYFAKVSGMTLRDWFAGQALAGTCANPEFFRMLVNLRKEILSSGRTALECDQIDQQILSKVCIAAADTLIATLKGGAE
jgi:hypothetical protein